MGTNKSTDVIVPKTIERLEKISKEQNDKRKLEEAEEDEEDRLKIMDDISIKLDTLDIHNLDKEIKLEPDILLNDIEVLT